MLSLSYICKYFPAINCSVTTTTISGLKEQPFYYVLRILQDKNLRKAQLRDSSPHNDNQDYFAVSSWFVSRFGAAKMASRMCQASGMARTQSPVRTLTRMPVCGFTMAVLGQSVLLHASQGSWKKCSKRLRRSYKVSQDIAQEFPEHYFCSLYQLSKSLDQVRIKVRKIRLNLFRNSIK